MSRIDTTIRTRLDAGEKVLIPYLVAGDPDLGLTLRLMHALAAAGADIIELGIPFSDPSSDGPVIQRGTERALAGGTTLNDVLQLVAEFRRTDSSTPVVLMGYLNPIEIMGYESFARRAGEAGVDGVLIVDLPPTESATLRRLLAEAELDLIFLVAPTTSETRARLIAGQCSGYLYYISLKGVTGAAITETDTIARNVSFLRSVGKLPIVIGFGIKDGESAAAMAALADGVVIGSALVERIAALQGRNGIDEAEVAKTVNLIASARQRLDQDS